MLDREAITALERARAAEKEQALFYRALAAQAEAAGDAEAVERLNGLHADEQHHLSRLTARLLELGEPIADLRSRPAPTAALERWESVARGREREEIERCRALLELPLDDATAALVREVLRAEELHERVLGGKWMRA